MLICLTRTDHQIYYFLIFTVQTLIIKGFLNSLDFINAYFAFSNLSKI